MSYEVMCVCGHFVRGERQRHHQVVVCANCGRRLFVLPRSPFEIIEESVPPVAPALSWHRAWAVPLLVGAGGLVLLLAGFLVIWFNLPPRSNGTGPVEEGPEVLLNQIEAGQRLLAQGRLQLALQTLDQAVSERNRLPKLLTPAQNRRLNQLQRQADLLARLSQASLEQIVREGMTTDNKEWPLHFDRYHRGWSIVFDDEVHRDAQGRLSLRNYVVEVKDAVIRLVLDNLTILQALPLDDSPRLIFGARLESCKIEEGGVWVIRFEPHSGVLLTDADALQAASAASLEPGLKSTLQRQQKWLDEHLGEPLNRE